MLNKLNFDLYTEAVNFITLHYNTKRTDSEFWKYMNENKNEWVKDVEEKCCNEFIDISMFDNMQTHIWSFDSYIQVLHGLGMFSKDAIRDYLTIKPNGQQILDYSERIYHEQQTRNMDPRNHSWVSHKGVIDAIK